ncbi:AAA family ATPase [Desulfoprunum benzoelyticum]|uniref:Type II secretory pathway predicted ATPase ExeA n=1 Tax=Desulfoprunum benzoelyticum TaxID=1506996 RepID=A0A840UZR8_9BACT|nr:AAA family ATPase [Desulfoprunum benzoelyticum]MBB5348944.1 type II secretory pathway predicted ATPase ExeA [Desulfoprunum benzoelyticum]MBM9530804.1 AAA family ATPase [Desulfoprunum benzoelyticum]
MDTQELRESEQVSIKHSPFGESAGTEKFFSGGMRQKVLDEMESALTGGIPIVTLTGEEGSGKTVLCRMLEDRMNSAFTTVYFPRMVDSFEDVLKAIVRKLGLITDPAPRNRAELLQSTVSHLHDHNLRVVLIFDEAERIFLATLERVRKMLDLANESGIFVQMVMAGRSGLHDNFRNLALCNFQPAEERHFSLEPLTEDETYEYLTSVMHGEAPEKRSLFSRKAAAAIFASSQGSFGEINRLADELLVKTEGGDKLDSVEDIGLEKKVGQDKPRRRLQRSAVAESKFTLNWRYLVWGGGAICIALAFFLFRPEGKTVGPQVEVAQDPEISNVLSKPGATERVEPDARVIEQQGPEKQENKEAPVAHIAEKKQRDQESISTPAPETVESAPAAFSTSAEPAVVSKPQSPETPATESRTEAEEKKLLAASTAGPPEREAEKEEKLPAAPVETNRRLEPVVETAAEESTTVDSVSQSQPARQEVTAVVDEADQPAAAIDETPIVRQTIKAQEVIKHKEELESAVRETIASQPVKILKQEEPDVFDMPAAPTTIRAIEQKKELELEPGPAVSAEQSPQAAEPEKVAVLASEKPRKTESVDTIYTSRVAAGASWLSGLKDDRYTVRLMVITSGDAEKKLKAMLGEKQYREQADKFYILRRESNPGVQYVYYGEYPTMTAARNARNTIPEFLRGYKPYAMSVKGAVQRAQQEE